MFRANRFRAVLNFGHDGAKTRGIDDNMRADIE